MNNFPPQLPVTDVFLPCLGLVDEFEVFDDDCSPGGVVAALGAVSTKAGEQSLAGETGVVHSVDVTEPSEAVDSELIGDGADVTSEAD